MIMIIGLVMTLITVDRLIGLCNRIDYTDAETIQELKIIK